MKKYAILIAVTFFAAPVTAAKAMNPIDDVDPIVRVIQEYKQSRTVLFVADCQDDDIKYVLMFPAGETEGEYAQIEFSEDQVITTNFGGILIENGSWHSKGATGGLSTRPVQESMMTRMMKFPFRILSSNELDQVYKNRSKLSCGFRKK